MIIPANPEWHGQAACRGIDPEMFHDDRRAAVALRFCQDCPVVIECLDEALDDPQLLGVRGGMTSKQRVAIRRRHRAKAGRQ